MDGGGGGAANNGAGVPAPSLCCFWWRGGACRRLAPGCSRRGGGGGCVGDFDPPSPSPLRWCLLRRLRGGVEVSVQECLVCSAVDLRWLGWFGHSWLGLVRRLLPMGIWPGAVSVEEGRRLRFSSPASSVEGGEAEVGEARGCSPADMAHLLQFRRLRRMDLAVCNAAWLLLGVLRFWGCGVLALFGSTGAAAAMELGSGGRQGCCA